MQHPFDNHLAVSIITKNLRGYKNLGQWITVKQSQQLKKEGFLQVLVGGTEIASQAKFKRQFMKNGETKKYYSYEVFNTTKSHLPQSYLRDFWS